MINPLFVLHGVSLLHHQPGRHLQLELLEQGTGDNDEKGSAPETRSQLDNSAAGDSTPLALPRFITSPSL